MGTKFDAILGKLRATDAGGGSEGGGVSAENVIEITTTPYAVSADDLNKVFVVNQAGAIVINLPVIADAEIGEIFELHKLGAGNVTVNADGAEEIADGTSVANTVAGQTYANMKLRIITATRWSLIYGLGSWVTS